MQGRSYLWAHSLCVCVAVAAVAGCTDDVPPSPTPRTAVTEVIKHVVEGNREFAIELYHELRREEAGNIFVSPYSISSALAMTYGGARGNTEQEMAKVMHFNLAQESLHATMGSLAGDLDATGKNRGYRLSIANRLWVLDAYEFLPAYLALTRNDYGAEATRLDFIDDTERSRQTINAWVAGKTEKRIQELLPKGSLGDDTILVLTNAIYFRGDWAEQFDEGNTKQQPFHVNSSERIDVPMMWQSHDLRYAETEALQLLELPYQGGDMSMTIVLPKEKNGLESIETQVSCEQLSEWSGQIRSSEVEVWLPKFTLTCEYDMKETFKALGMNDAFEADAADFSGMDGTRDLSISKILHKAFIDVNEEGTEAAVATAVAVTTESAPEPLIQFRADHPFLFFIQDKSTGTMLFFGRVTNPSQ